MVIEQKISQIHKQNFTQHYAQYVLYTQDLVILGFRIQCHSHTSTLSQEFHTFLTIKELITDLADARDIPHRSNSDEHWNSDNVKSTIYTAAICKFEY